MVEQISDRPAKIAETIETSGNQVKSDLLAFRREVLPELPIVCGIMSGFRSSFERDGRSTEGAQEAVRLEVPRSDDSETYLEANGIYNVSRKWVGSERHLDWENKREVPPESYIAFAGAAIREIIKCKDLKTRIEASS